MQTLMSFDYLPDLYGKLDALAAIVLPTVELRRPERERFNKTRTF